MALIKTDIYVRFLSRRMAIAASLWEEFCSAMIQFIRSSRSNFQTSIFFFSKKVDSFILPSIWHAFFILSNDHLLGWKGRQEQFINLGDLVNGMCENNTKNWSNFSFHLLLYYCAQPLRKFLSFLAGYRAYEGMGKPRGPRRFRKTHLENILPSPFWDRDPRYPKGGPKGPKNFFEKFSQENLFGYI